MDKQNESTENLGALHGSSSPDLLFEFDEAENVIRLADGSEIDSRIIESIDIQYPAEEPENEYLEWKPLAVEAVIHIKEGWLWRDMKTVHASEYRDEKNGIMCHGRVAKLKSVFSDNAPHHGARKEKL